VPRIVGVRPFPSSRRLGAIPYPSARRSIDCHEPKSNARTALLSNVLATFKYFGGRIVDSANNAVPTASSSSFAKERPKENVRF
ncbi:unnamed protein product, partial [Ixodes pacificus]